MLAVRNILIPVLVSLFHLNCGLHYPVMDVGSGHSFEPGKCYHEVYVEDEGFEFPPLSPHGFILEFVPPKFEEIEVTYTWEELEQYKYKDEYKIPWQSGYLYYVKKDLPNNKNLDYVEKNSDLYKVIKSRPDVYGYQFCISYVPIKYWTVSKEKLIADNLNMPMKRLVSNGNLTKIYVKKKPKRLAYNQFYFKGGYWTEIREMLQPNVMYAATNRQIEERLKELGYSIIVNGIITEAEVEAIKDFRKKNNIKTDYFFDFETLKALGLQ